MLPTRIILDIVEPTGRVLMQEVEEIVLPGAEGYLGVRPGHTPYLVALGIGVLSYRAGGRERLACVAEGVAEILPDAVSVLTAAAELAEEIDADRARAAQKKAQDTLARPPAPGEETAIELARGALLRAENRLKVLALRR
jgi:F-type H+-transporting ATPase subunit epsilon